MGKYRAENHRKIHLWTEFINSSYKQTWVPLRTSDNPSKHFSPYFPAPLSFFFFVSRQQQAYLQTVSLSFDLWTRNLPPPMPIVFDSSVRSNFSVLRPAPPHPTPAPHTTILRKTFPVVSPPLTNLLTFISISIKLLKLTKLFFFPPCETTFL